MSLIPIRILKIKLVETDEAQDFALEMHLMRPALEPFVMIRAIMRNVAGAICSVQFVPEAGGEFHYMNFVHAPDWPEGALLDITAVADLPLTPGQTWRVLQFGHNGETADVGRIFRDTLGLWRFEGSLKHKGIVAEAASATQFMLIGGAPKSGTTWVEYILNNHPKALATGENGFFEWPSRDELNRLMEQRAPPYYSRVIPQKPPFRSQSAMCYAGRAERILSQIAATAGVRLVGDKSPGNGKYLSEILSTLPDWKYVHCVRHPLDVAVSRFFHERNLLLDSPDLSSVPPDHALRSYILSYNKDRAKRGDMFGDIRVLDLMVDSSLEGSIALSIVNEYESIHIVRYEDLLSNFVDTVRRLFLFCGLEANDELLADIACRTRFEAYSGGRPAGEGDERSFFRKGIAGDHLNYMTPEQIQYARNRVLMQCGWYRSYFEDTKDV